MPPSALFTSVAYETTEVARPDCTLYHKCSSNKKKLLDKTEISFRTKTSAHKEQSAHSKQELNNTKISSSYQFSAYLVLICPVSILDTSFVAVPSFLNFVTMSRFPKWDGQGGMIGRHPKSFF